MVDIFLARGRWRGHAAGNDDAHLLRKVEGASDFEGGSAFCADASGEVVHAAFAGGEGGAGADAGSSGLKEFFPQDGCDVDERGADVHVAAFCAAAFCPVDGGVGLGELHQFACGGTPCQQPGSGVQQLISREGVFLYCCHFPYFLVQFLQGGGEDVFRPLRGAQTHGSVVGIQLAVSAGGAEEFFRGYLCFFYESQEVGGGAAAQGSFVSVRVVEPEQVIGQLCFTETEPQLVGRHGFDGVRLIQNHEIPGKDEALRRFLIFRCGFFCQCQQSEKEGVVQDDYPGILYAAAGGLIGAVRSAVAGGADVVFTANLSPDFWGDVQFRRQFCEGAFSGSAAVEPELQVMQLLGFCLVKEVGGLLQRAAESGFAEVVGTPFQQGCGELAVQRTGYGGYVFVEELFLQVDGVGGYDGFPVMFQREAYAGDEVGERFTHACACFCQ